MRRVLVVDDKPLIADTLVTLLNQEGFEATAAYGGGAGVREALRLRPDIVISDVIMPDLNGVEASIEIQQAHPECKILLWSGQFGAFELLQQAKAVGYDFELLAKPLEPRELLQKLR